jgi:hypothetical protein
MQIHHTLRRSALERVETVGLYWAVQGECATGTHHAVRVVAIHICSPEWNGTEGNFEGNLGVK